MALWTKNYKDGAAFPSITGAGGASPTNISSTSTLTGIANGTLANWTGGNITTALTISGKSNVTLRGLRFSGNGSITISGTSTNIRVEDCQAPQEKTDGNATIFVRGAYNKVQIDDSLFGSATTASSPTATKNRFIMFGDSGSTGSPFGTVTRTTFRNKNGPGNPVHTSGDTGNTAGQGGVKYTLVSQCYFYKTIPFDENDHESCLMGLSNMQLTDGQTIIEWCRFEECASEPEVISNKMNNGTIRGCTFINCVGSASLRHGDGSKIHDCHFYGDASATAAGSTSVRVSAGTRMYGRDHEIHHNTIRVRGDANYERPILLDTGDTAPGSTSNGHANVVNASVHDNLLVDCRAPIVVGDNYSTAPTGSIRDNMVVKCDNAGSTGILVINNISMSGISTSGNQVFSTTADAGLTQGPEGEWHHDTKGARTVLLTTSMVGKGTTFDPYVNGWYTGSGGGSTVPAITVSGNKIYRGTQEWWFLGYNSFTWSGDCGDPGEVLTATQLDTMMSNMRHDGHGALRLFFYDGWDITRMDAAIESAKTHNIYLMITLDDAIGGCGTSTKSSSWFSNSTATSAYQAHMEMMLNRYKDENIIAWFEYFNEPSAYGGALRTFYDSMGAVAASIDPNRLFCSGTLADYDTGGPSGYLNIHQSSGVDIASLHEYDGGEIESNHGPDVRANSAGKPVIVGECGINANSSGSGCDYDFAGRAAQINAKAAVYADTSLGYCGMLMWAWQPGTGASTCDTSNLDVDTASQNSLRTFTADTSGGGGGGGGTDPGTTKPTPSEVLHIAKNTAGWNRMNWGLGTTEHVDHTLDEIGSGWEDDPWFFVKQNVDGKWVVEASAPLNGARTSANTSYPRSEGRELIYGADGTAASSNRASWQPAGEHYIAGFYRITAVTSNKPEICIQQIHDGGDDQLMVRLQTGGKLRFLVRGVNVLDNAWGSTYTPAENAPEFFLMQGIFDGQPKFWLKKVGDVDFPTTVAQIHALRSTTPTYAGSASEFDSNFTGGFYVKSGAYLQSNTSTDPSEPPDQPVMRMQFRNLVVWHTGQPTPAEYATSGKPLINAGADTTISLSTALPNRTATESANGGTITSRAWKIYSGPLGAGSTLSTTTALNGWTPTMAGVYDLTFESTNENGTTTDHAVITVQDTTSPPPTGEGITPSFVSMGTPYSGESTSVVVPAPPGVTAGMAQFCIIQDAGDEELTGIPPNWELMDTVLVQSASGDPGGPSRSWLCYNSTGDSSSRTWTKSGSRFTHAVRFCYKDYRILGTHLAIQTPSGLQHELPEVSPTSANAKVVGIIVADLLNVSAGPVQPPEGWIERYDQTKVSGTENETIAIADVNKNDLAG